MTDTRLDVNYLLEDTALFGGVKVVLQHADLLSARGHRVTVVSKGPSPDWYPLESRFLRVTDLESSSLPPADVKVATFWTTIAAALAGSPSTGQALHFCQGFEGSYTHNLTEHEAIRAAYSCDLPAIAVSPHLVELLDRDFDRAALWVPQPRDLSFSPAKLKRSPRRRPRILVCSPFEIDWKGVATAIEAVRELRERGLDLVLVRLSQWPLGADERALLVPDEFHEGLRPAEAAQLFRGCDLLLAPSWEQEGFGLPVLEAMASGVPVVASEVSCFRAFAGGAARLVRPDDPSAFATAAADLLGNRARWRAARRQGLRVARRFTGKRTVRALEEAMRWAVSGAWKPRSSASERSAG